MKKRTFILVDENNRDTPHKFTGTYPNKAGKKLATRGYKNIRLRETTKKTIHIYIGRREKIKKSTKSSAYWLPNEIYSGFVKKITTERL